MWRIEEVVETETNEGLFGFYVVDECVTDTTPDEWVWNDRGNGPEVKQEGVTGPFKTAAAAEQFIAAEVEYYNREHATKAECPYCGNTVVEDKVPRVYDDEGWAVVKRDYGHADDCEWVNTRAHQDEVAIDQLKGEKR